MYLWEASAGGFSINPTCLTGSWRTRLCCMTVRTVCFKTLQKCRSDWLLQFDLKGRKWPVREQQFTKTIFLRRFHLVRKAALILNKTSGTFKITVWHFVEKRFFTFLPRIERNRYYSPVSGLNMKLNVLPLVDFQKEVLQGKEETLCLCDEKDFDLRQMSMRWCSSDKMLIF